MASTTTLGYPYPDDTDSVSDGAGKVQELAQYADDNAGIHRAGTQASGTLVAATPKTVAVAFASPFPAAGPVPKVTATITGLPFSGSAVAYVGVDAVTRSGFNLIIRRETGTASIDVNYHAIAL